MLGRSDIASSRQRPAHSPRSQEVSRESVRFTPVARTIVLADRSPRAVFVRADATPQTLPFAQDWTNPGLIATNDDWTGVPGIQGFLGQGITGATGADPQTAARRPAPR